MPLLFILALLISCNADRKINSSMKVTQHNGPNLHQDSGQPGSSGTSENHQDYGASGDHQDAGTSGSDDQGPSSSGDDLNGEEGEESGNPDDHHDSGSSGGTSGNSGAIIVGHTGGSLGTSGSHVPQTSGESAGETTGDDEEDPDATTGTSGQIAGQTGNTDPVPHMTLNISGPDNALTTSCARYFIRLQDDQGHYVPAPADLTLTISGTGNFIAYNQNCLPTSSSPSLTTTMKASTTYAAFWLASATSGQASIQIISNFAHIAPANKSITIAAPTAINGRPDASFGNSKIGTTNYAGVLSVPSGTNKGTFIAVAPQPDGNILALSYDNTQEFKIMRYLPNGRPDPTFANFHLTSAYPSDLLLQSDNKILAIGTSSTQPSAAFVMRLNPDGTTDNTFGTNGRTDPITFSPSQSRSSGITATVQPDGRIIMAATISESSIDSSGRFCSGYFGIARFLPNGKLDTSFNGIGSTVIKAFCTGWASSASIGLQQNGQIIFIGWSRPYFGIARFNPNGSQDLSFGSGTFAPGFASEAFAGDLPIAQAGIVQRDDKIVVGGTDGDKSFQLVRFLANGRPDTDFGTRGTTLTTFGNTAMILSLGQQADGKILAGGFAPIPAQANSNLTVARYRLDGLLDTTFANSGLSRTSLGTRTKYASSGEALQCSFDGRINLSGEVKVGSANNYIILRLLP